MLNDNANKRLNVTPTSSLDSFNPKDDHSLNFIGRSSYNSNSSDVQLLNNSDSTTNNNTFSTKSYSSTDGYGLTNAAAAVAKATGQNTYADVVDLGGNH